MAKNTKNQTTEIGYKQPPKATQFKPGQSGNRKGRPKGSKNLQTVMTEELSTLVPITENGRHKKVPKSQVMIKQLANKAAAGDHKATQLLLTHLLRIDEQNRSSGGSPLPEVLAPEDQLVLDSIINRIRNSEPSVIETVPESPVEAQLAAPESPNPGESS